MASNNFAKQIQSEYSDFLENLRSSLNSLNRRRKTGRNIDFENYLKQLKSYQENGVSPSVEDAFELGVEFTGMLDDTFKHPIKRLSDAIQTVNNSKGNTSESSESSNSESKDKETEKATDENKDDSIEFTYVPGDTFGQKILDLGIGTDNGLWGENGDVAYYTQQLIDGGYLDDNGNVKLGVPIRLKKRK